MFGNERACIKPINGPSIGHFHSFMLDIPSNDFIFLSDFSRLGFSSPIDVPHKSLIAFSISSPSFTSNPILTYLLMACAIYMKLLVKYYFSNDNNIIRSDLRVVGINCCFCFSGLQKYPFSYFDIVPIFPMCHYKHHFAIVIMGPIV